MFLAHGIVGSLPVEPSGFFVTVAGCTIEEMWKKSHMPFLALMQTCVQQCSFCQAEVPGFTLSFPLAALCIHVIREENKELTAGKGSSVDHTSSGMIK